MEYQFEEIVECKQIGNFGDDSEDGLEYVYDIEVEDNSHTFIANDILVHNSCYTCFDEVLETFDLENSPYKGREVNFFLDLYEHRLKDYLKKQLDEFARNRNVENIQVFELENICSRFLITSKKKYLKDVAWEEPNIFHKFGEAIKYTGLEIIQSSTPSILRKELKKITDKILTDETVYIKDVATKLAELKKMYISEPDLDRVCRNVRVNNYEKYCLADVDDFKFGEKCPFNVRAAIYYNYMLNNSDVKDKYEGIMSGDKVKVYYSKDIRNENFAYKAGRYPREIAPEIDYDTMFFKSTIEPVNNLLEAIGVQTLDEKLSYRNIV